MDGGALRGRSSGAREEEEIEVKEQQGQEEEKNEEQEATRRVVKHHARSRRVPLLHSATAQCVRQSSRLCSAAAASLCRPTLRQQRRIALMT